MATKNEAWGRAEVALIIHGKKACDACGKPLERYYYFIDYEVGARSKQRERSA